MDISPLMEPECLAYWLQTVPPSQAEKINRLKNQSSKTQSLGAYLLTAQAVYLWENRRQNCEGELSEQRQANQRQSCQMNFKQIDLRQLEASALPSLEFKKGVHGKPILCNYAEIYVNRSHSGSYVAVSIGDEENGVDIQKHEQGDFSKIARRFFHEAEQARLGETASAFYDQWTKKEAYIKFTGLGMQADLRAFDADHIEAAMSRLIGDIPGYSVAVCTAK